MELLINKKEWILQHFDTFYNMVELSGDYGKQKKPVTKNHILHDSTDIRQIYRHGK